MEPEQSEITTSSVENVLCSFVANGSTHCALGTIRVK